MFGQDLREPLYQKMGTDLTAIEGIGIATALVILTEVGPDLSRSPRRNTLPPGWVCAPTTGLAEGRS